MAAIAGTIKNIVMLRDPYDGASGRHLAEVFVTYPAYTASSDTTTVAAVGVAISNARGDGKTVTLKSVCEGQTGLQGTTEFYNDTLAVSTDAITGELSNDAGTEIDAASGVSDRPCSFVVAYKLA